MEPLEYLGIIKRRWRVIVAAVVLAAAIGAVSAPGTSEEEPTSFQASHVLLYNGQTPINLSQTALLAQAGDVPDRAASRLGSDVDGDDVAATMDASADAETGTIVITARATDPTRAEAVADTVAQELVASLAEQGQQAQQSRAGDVLQRLDGLRVTIEDLDARLVGASDEESDLVEAERDAIVNQYRLTYEELQQLASQEAPVGPLSTLEEAQARVADDSSAFAPPDSRAGRALLAGIVGLLLGLAIALLQERLDTRLRTKEATERTLGVPVVGEIPASRQAGAKDEIETIVRPGSPASEAFRILRTTLLFLQSWGEPDPSGADRKQVLLVTSPGPSEGKTTTVANLAAVFAEAGHSVLVLDCDLRRPRLHQLFGVGDGPGLHDAVSARSRSEWLASAVRQTNLDRVRIVADGKPIESPAAYLNIARELITAGRELADIVLVDTAPLLSANDALELASVVDGVLLITRSSRTTASSARRAVELLGRLGAPVVGSVLVAAPEVQASYSTAYYARSDAPARRRAAPVLVPSAPVAPSAPSEGASASAPAGLPMEVRRRPAEDEPVAADIDRSDLVSTAGAGAEGRSAPTDDGAAPSDVDASQTKAPTPDPPEHEPHTVSGPTALIAPTDAVPPPRPEAAVDPGPSATTAPVRDTHRPTPTPPSASRPPAPTPGAADGHSPAEDGIEAHPLAGTLLGDVLKLGRRKKQR